MFRYMVTEVKCKYVWNFYSTTSTRWSIGKLASDATNKAVSEDYELESEKKSKIYN
jgi:hypothetical protein